MTEEPKEIEEATDVLLDDVEIHDTKAPACFPQWQRYFAYLDDLKDSGICNMFEGPIYLQKEYRLSHEYAKKIYVSWMNNYGNAQRYRNE